MKVLWKYCEHITSLIVIINNFPSQMVMKFVVNSKYDKIVLVVSLVAQKKVSIVSHIRINNITYQLNNYEIYCVSIIALFIAIINTHKIYYPRYLKKRKRNIQWKMLELQIILQHFFTNFLYDNGKLIGKKVILILYSN